MSIQENSQSEMSIDEQLRSEMSIDEEELTADFGESAPFLETPPAPPQSVDVGKTSAENLAISELPSNILPSNADIVGYYKFKKIVSKNTINTLKNEIAEELIEIWSTTGIPTQKSDYVKRDIKKLIGKKENQKYASFFKFYL